MGIFHRFIDDATVRLVGVEAGGEGIESGRHAARFAASEPGVLHGTLSYLMQDDDGQTIESHSISAGLDYPSVGPEHSFLRDSGRAEYRYATDEQAMAAFELLCKTEGIIPAIESAHALAGAMELGTELGPDALLLVNLSGRGDKDVHTAARYFGLLDRGGQRPVSAGVGAVLEQCRAGESCRPGGLPARRVPRRGGLDRGHGGDGRGGRDIVEVGVPYSDPLMDGPVIAYAADQALKRGARVRDLFTATRAVREAGAPPLGMTYWNLILRYGPKAFARDLAEAGGAGMITPDLIPDEAGRGSRPPTRPASTGSSSSPRARRSSAWPRSRASAGGSCTPPHTWVSPAPAPVSATPPRSSSGAPRP